MEQVKPTSYRELEINVLRWAEARKIIPRSYPLAQVRKTLEETGELTEAATKLRLLQSLEPYLPPEVYVEQCQQALKELKDAVGDVVVTLINACALADVDLVLCLSAAYEEIRERKGTLREDGVFVKEAPPISTGETPTITVGQRWGTRDGSTALILDTEYSLKHPIRIDVCGATYSLTSGGYYHGPDERHALDIVRLLGKPTMEHEV